MHVGMSVDECSDAVKLKKKGAIKYISFYLNFSDTKMCFNNSAFWNSSLLKSDSA